MPRPGWCGWPTRHPSGVRPGPVAAGRGGAAPARPAPAAGAAVGAGGLGQQLDNSTKMFAGGEVATMLLVFIALVALADKVSAWLREALA